MFMLYNAVLRKFPQKLIDMMEGTKYVTTVHGINSAIIKLSLATQLLPRDAWRGSNKMKLPLAFAAPDHLGRQGIVEMGFLSLTILKEMALDYAAGDALSTVLKIMRGDMSSGACIAPLSFYIEEEEVLIPPLAYLEVCPCLSAQHLYITCDLCVVLFMQCSALACKLLTFVSFTAGGQSQRRVHIQRPCCQRGARDHHSEPARRHHRRPRPAAQVSAHGHGRQPNG